MGDHEYPVSVEAEGLVSCRRKSVGCVPLSLRVRFLCGTWK